jgi:hypothetical protein
MEENLNIQIEKYLFNQMSTDEKEAFEKKLIADPAIQKELELAKLEHASMKFLLEDHLKQQIDTWKKEASTSKGKIVKFGTTSRIWKSLGIAASILILLSFGINFFVLNNYKNSKLAEMYGSPFLLQERGQKESKENKDLLLLLSSKNYSKVLTELTAKNNLSESQIYFRGIAFRETGKTQEAIKDFNYLLQQTNSTQIKENAEWELVITYLKNHDKSSLNKALKDILNTPDHSFMENAKSLSEKINSVWFRLAN